MSRLLLILLTFATNVYAASPPSGLTQIAHQHFDTYCFDCHDSDAKKGELDLESLLTMSPKRSKQWPPLASTYALVFGLADLWTSRCFEISSRTLRLPPPRILNKSRATDAFRMTDSSDGKLVDGSGVHPVPGQAGCW